MLSQEHKEFLKTEIGRKWFINKLTEKEKDNKTPKLKINQWQQHHTPYWLCEKIINKTNVAGKSILVLFNIEFIEVLIHKFGVLSKNITFIADCQIESAMATKIYHVNSIVVNNIENIREVVKSMKNFDLCFTNPPYTGNMDALVLSEILPVCTEIIAVHPAAWLLDNKYLPKSYFTKYREKIKNYCESAYIFDGNSAFGIIGPCSPFTIFKINKKYKGKISVNYFDHQYFDVDSVYDITTFENNWVPIVKPFVEVMKKYPNIWDHHQRIKDNSFPAIGNFYFKCRSLLPGSAGNDVWDCLIQLNSPNSRYIVNYDQLELERASTRIRYYFKTLNEINNFINYLKTDFVRFCISIYKTNQHFDSGELRLVPWIDFSKPWTDADLYKHFNIPQQTIDYITNFFPDDIYGLRNKS